MYMILKRLRSLLPTKLPVGMAEFHEFANDIIELSGKYADEDSIKFVISSIIMHLGPQKSSVSKHYFVKSLRKVAANQVAGQVFQDIKLKQQEDAKAAQQAEVTASQEIAAPDVQKV